MAAVNSEDPATSLSAISPFFIQAEVFLVPALMSDFLLKHNIFYEVVRLRILFRPFVLADATWLRRSTIL